MKKFRLFAVLLTILSLSLLLLRESAISYFAFAPEKLMVAPENVDTFGAEELYIEAPDGIRLHAFYMPANTNSLNVDSISSPARAVIYLHGNAGHSYNRLETINELRGVGVDVLLVDYRGFGLSDGEISEQGMYLDAQAAFDHLIAKGVSAKEIVVMGRSIGSVAALKLANDNDIAGVILISPIASAAEMAKVMGLGWLAFLAHGALDNIERTRSLTKPLLILHGDEDVMVPLSQGGAVFDAAADNAPYRRLVVVKRATHHNIRTVAGAAYWQWIATFIRSLN